MPTLIPILKLLRPKQWVKNTFIFFPIIFSGQIAEQALWGKTLLTFIGFCCAASSMYIFNDFLDLRKDQFHPKKANRPLAKLNIPTPMLALIILGFMFIGIYLCQQVNPAVLMTAIGYLTINLIYNLGIKQMVILDVIFIALGFQVRIWAGAFAVDVIPSEWLQLCVFLLALFLGFNKRRHELENLKETASLHRKVLGDYSIQLLDQLILISATLAIVFYGLYTISPEILMRMGNHRMVYSLIFVIYGLFRYLFLVHVKKIGDDPGEILLQDKPLMINIFLWIAYLVVLLYPGFLG